MSHCMGAVELNSPKINFENEPPPVIIDIGTFSTKAGFANNDPFAVRTISDMFARGFICDWSRFENHLHDLYKNHLHVDSSTQPLMLCEPFFNLKHSREIQTQKIFEEFNVCAFFTAQTPPLAAYANGRTTGLVIESGHSGTNMVSIHEGYSLFNSSIKLSYGGHHLTEYLMKLLAAKKVTFQSEAFFKNTYFQEIPPELVKKIDLFSGKEFSHVWKQNFENTIKEKMCYIAEDFVKEEQKKPSDLEKSFTLPDGRTIVLGTERFSCPEALFKPDLLGIEDRGLDDAAYTCIMKSDMDIRRELYYNTVFSGGNTCFPGLKERYVSAIQLYAERFVHKVAQSSQPQLAPWFGGSVLASLVSFQDSWITMDMYDESGPSIVRYCYI